MTKGPEVAGDDGLLQELRVLAGKVDPIPSDTVFAARSAFAFRRIDAELAELSEDSLAAMRAGEAGEEETERVLTFTVGERSIEMEAMAEATGWRLVGQLVPPTQGHVTVRSGSGDHVDEFDTDSLGRFANSVTAGGVSLTVTWADGRKADTQWVVL